MSGFRHGVAEAAEQAVDLVQQVPAAARQARDVLEDDKRHRVIGPCLAHQPDAAQRQLVQRLVLRSQAHLLRQQAAGTLAGRADEHGIRSAPAGGAPNILRGRLPPACRRLLAVEPHVLVAGEQVEQGARDAGQALEVAQSGRVHVDATEAFPPGFDVADPRTRPVEACGAAAEAAAEVEVVEGALKHGCYPRTGRRRCRTSRRRIRSGRSRAW